MKIQNYWALVGADGTIMQYFDTLNSCFRPCLFVTKEAARQEWRKKNYDTAELIQVEVSPLSS